MPSALPTPSSQARVSVEKYAVVGDSYVAHSDQRERDQAQHADEHERRRQAARAVLAARGPGDPADQEQRPDEVELLLHRQRPVVLQRRGRLALGEVVGADGREADVGREGGDPDGVLDDLDGPDEREEEDGGDHGRHGHHGGGRAGSAGRGGRRTPAARSGRCAAASRISSEVIRKPEITKKTSTPTKPPETVPKPEWATITSRTASARRPWMSGRKWRSFCTSRG